MTSVPPQGLSSPMLLGGPHAQTFAELAGPLGMQLRVFSERIGEASSVKMCRSVMIKGLEALATECMLAARHYGVEQEVLGTLGDTLPHEDWPDLARYVISRALLHGKRRAEEMREVARTVSEAGSRAAAQPRHRRAAGLGVGAGPDDGAGRAGLPRPRRASGRARRHDGRPAAARRRQVTLWRRGA